MIKKKRKSTRKIALYGGFVGDKLDWQMMDDGWYGGDCRTLLGSALA